MTDPVNAMIQFSQYGSNEENGVAQDLESGAVRMIGMPLAGLVGVVGETLDSGRLLVEFEQIGHALASSIGTAKAAWCAN